MRILKAKVVVKIMATAVLFICGCTISNIGSLSILMTPSSATVQTGQTQQFTVTAGGSTPTGATWAVGDIAGDTIIAGGNSTIGTVSSTGLYTAPQTIPSPSQVKVMAIGSGTSSNGSGTTILSSAIVTITGASGGSPTPAAAISVSPTSITPGGSATLLWTTSGVDSCLINGQSTINGLAVGTGGNISVSPSQTTTYQLACTGPNGSASNQATLTVQSSSSPPPSSGVTISPATASVTSGSTIQLTATVPNDPNNYGVVWTTSIGQTSQPVALTSTTATYTVPIVTQTIVITVKATSVANSTQFGTATITVNP